MRRAIGGLLLAVGILMSVVAGGILWLRATADVGEPWPVVYAFAGLGPALAVAGAVLCLRRARLRHPLPGR